MLLNIKYKTIIDNKNLHYLFIEMSNNNQHTPDVIKFSELTGPYVGAC